MNKERIDEIALRVAKDRYVAQHSGTGDGINFANYAEFTHALLAELAKEQEPVAKIDYKAPYGISFTLEGSRIKDGTELFTRPLPQPDLVDELNAQHAFNAK